MLEAKGIHKVYGNGKKTLPVLKGVELNIGEAEFVAIVGPSGAGKSTLLHILGGLDNPTKGRVIFEQEDIYSLGDNEISRVRNEKIGFVFQFFHLLPDFTVLENVLMPTLIIHRTFLERKDLKNEALTLLEEVGLKNRTSHFPSQLSGGEKQRVAIVRGLINRPRILLCDEPTGNLDSKTGEDIVFLIKKINTESKMAVVLVTHNQELAKVADRTHHLIDGVLVN